MDEASGIRFIDDGDLERVVVIDALHTNHSRRGFFEKRFSQAAVHPGDFVQIGFVRGGFLGGFAIAHLQRGQFGHEHAVAVLDVLGVERESQDHGMGQALIGRLLEILKQKGVRVLHSQASWKNHDLLRFFDRCGFALSSRVVLERSITEPLIEPMEEPA